MHSLARRCGHHRFLEDGACCPRADVLHLHEREGQPEFSEQPCSGGPAEKVESLNCRKARQDLEAVRFADLRRAGLPARGAAMNSACGLKPPHVTIIGKPALPKPYSGVR